MTSMELLKRQKVAAQAETFLALLDMHKRDMGCSHGEMLAVVAASIAALPEPDRRGFKELLEIFEAEMQMARAN